MAQKILFVAIILVALGITGLASNQQMFEEIEPIVWIETNDGVEYGVKQVMLELSIVTPCNSLKRTLKEVFDDKPYSYLQERCHESYMSMVAKNFDILSDCLPQDHKMRVKRIVPLLVAGGFALYSIASDITSVSYSYGNSGSSYNRLNQKDILDEKQNREIEYLKNLTNQTLNSLVEAKNIRGQMINMSESNSIKIEQNSRNINRLTFLTPNMAWDSAQLFALLQASSTSLKKLNTSCKRRKLNVDAISEFTKTNMFEDVSEKDTYLESVTRVSNQTIRFVFNIKVFDKDTKIYKPIWFYHHQNLTTDQAMVKYAGPDFRIYNVSSNCSRGLDREDLKFKQTCTLENYSDPNLFKWERVTRDEERRHEMQVFSTDRNYLVYCLFQRIYIVGKIKACPPFPFKVLLDEPFRVGNMSHSVEKMTVQLQGHVVELKSSSFEGRSGSDYAKEVGYYEVIRARNDNSIPKSILNYEKGHLIVSEQVLAIIVVSVILVLLCFCGLYYCLKRQSNRQSNQPNITINNETMLQGQPLSTSNRNFTRSQSNFYNHRYETIRDIQS